MYQKVKEGIFFHNKYGRVMEHRGYATRIFWSTAMIDYLKTHFSTTLNEELAGCLGVSPRTIVRKARELGLRKSDEWLDEIWEQRRHLAHSVSNRKGNPGSFQKGHRYNPDGEFKKGHQLSQEEKKKQAASIRRWYRLHPEDAKTKAAKAWETRRKNLKQQKI